MRDVEDAIEVGGRTLHVVRPADAEALISEEAFARDELLPYWAEAWPSGVELARHVAAQDVRGLRVLELGCGGRALPAIAAALGGAAHVLATDWAPDALAYARANAGRNGAEVEVLQARWDEPAPLLARGPWDLVLAADVLYERRLAAPLLALLRALGAPAWVADPSRDAAQAFWELAGDAARRRTLAGSVQLAVVQA